MSDDTALKDKILKTQNTFNNINNKKKVDLYRIIHTNHTVASLEKLEMITSAPKPQG